VTSDESFKSLKVKKKLLNQKVKVWIKKCIYKTSRKASDLELTGSAMCISAYTDW
jgi:hypothetical protein